jgi:hypothetical protein
MTADENAKNPNRPENGETREYRVVWDRAYARYQVVCNDGRSFGFSGNKGGAIGMAMRAAIKDDENGVRASVHVQQKGGSFKVEWVSK